MANDAVETFWGCTLTKGKKEYSWNPTETEEDIEHKLQVTSACLGAKAKDGERNLVELTTEDDDGNQTTCSMVSLRVGGKECIHLELGFNNPTKFTLREGSGPISLCGVHLQAGPLDFDNEMESDEDTDDEDIPNLVEPKVSKKDKPVIKVAENKKEEIKPEKSEEKLVPVKTEATTDKKDDKKKGKRVLEEDKEDRKQDKATSKKKKIEPELVEEDDDDDDEESDEDEEEEEGEEGDSEEDDEEEDEEMPSLLDGEAEEDEEEESEDEDEPEGDDVDSEDDEEDEDEGEQGDEDDEDDESEEEETPVKPKKKQPLTNGHTPKNKKEDSKPNQKSKTPSKTPQKTPSKAKKSTDEIKAMLLKSPNLPKKLEKFENYMKNNMKVTDKKTLSEVWDFVQKNRK